MGESTRFLDSPSYFVLEPYVHGFNSLIHSHGWTIQILTTVADDPGGIAKICAGRVISGVGVGAISAVAPAYVSECSPKEVRGRVTGIFQMMVKTLLSIPSKTNNRVSRLLSAS